MEYDREEAQNIAELYPLSDLENAVPQEPNLETPQSKSYQENPALNNKYPNNFWKDERPLKLFRMRGA
ncbi:hypothetical protein PGTUg99_032542 [Puccinia graminis f. sp. tritici]|uniref:Uncharacterized protein n=1 Tax=Puccinia graminis f. sp. tritici TaxID=56615 RepID=A0A5B0RHD3_PUCGR|nr:hypothetical protein PGTUg99_032542 [Puccinia graminis f. sp. tritici]